jgi:hypothetical protein
MPSALGCEDCEQEDGNDEPSLGWTMQEAGRGEYAGGLPDLEEQCDDEGDQSDTGVGDIEGLLEQVGSQDWTQTVMA